MLSRASVQTASYPLTLRESPMSAFVRVAKSSPKISIRDIARFREMVSRVCSQVIGTSGQAPMESIMGLKSDIGIGLDYVRREKGDSGLAFFLDSSELPKLVRIGRQLKEKKFWDQQRRIVQENTLTIPESGREMPFCGLFDRVLDPEKNPGFHDLDTDIPRLLKTFSLKDIQKLFFSPQFEDLAGMEQFLEGLEQIEAILSLKSDVGLTRGTFFQLLTDRESGLTNLLAGDTVGILEIAIFVRIFHHRKKRRPKPPVLILPDDLAKDFFLEIQYSRIPARFHSHVLPSYQSACHEIFREKAHEAWILLKYYLISILEKIDEDRETFQKISSQLAPLYTPIKKIPNKLLQYKEESS